jgi:hypothetical protein
MAPIRIIVFALAVAFSCAIAAEAGAQQQPNAAEVGTASNQDHVFFVPSSGWLADRTFIAMSGSSGHSSISQQLEQGLEAAERGALQVTVAGKSEPKTVQVIKDAFRALGSKQLPNLDLTFVGTAKTSEEIAKLVAAVGATYDTREALGF